MEKRRFWMDCDCQIWIVGRIGEEIIRVINDTQQTATDVQIRAAQKMAACPGRRRTNSGREGDPGTYIVMSIANLKVFARAALAAAIGGAFTGAAAQVAGGTGKSIATAAAAGALMAVAHLFMDNPAKP